MNEETSQTSKPGRTIAITVDGVRYEVAELDLRAPDIRELRKETGMSFMRLVETFEADPDLDLVAAFLWLARRSNGEPSLRYADVANGMGYSSDFEFERVGEQEPAEELPET